MSGQPISNHQKIHEQFLALDKIGTKLNAWQQEFLISTQDWYYEHGELSPEQVKKLDEIYREHFL